MTEVDGPARGARLRESPQGGWRRRLAGSRHSPCARASSPNMHNVAYRQGSEEALEETLADLVIIDPIQSFLRALIDAHRSNETRPILDVMRIVLL